MLRYFLIAAFSGCMIVAAQADLLRRGDTRWLVIASTEDIDNAIGIANIQSWRFEDVRVVEASNNWLAVIAGPIPTPNGLKAALKALKADGSLPSDVFLSDGQRFKRTLWVSTNPAPIRSWEHRSDQPLHVELDGFTMEVTGRRSGNSDLDFPVLSVRQAGRLLLEEGLEDVEVDPDRINAEIKFVILDHEAPKPQIMFSANWMGAHCCTATKFLYPQGDNWISIAGSTLDGEGYQLEDLDGDGTVELLSADNSFLYAFAPYVSSWAPLVIEKLSDGRLQDMRTNPEFRRYYRRKMYGLEYHAKVRPELWRENGFLAAWVALKSIVGEFDDAWHRMLANYDRSSDWPLNECTVPEKNGVCPSGSERPISFPQALRSHLERTGYIQGGAEVVQAPRKPEPETVASKSNAAPSPRKQSSGTGFVVSKLGHVVTNHHVIDECSDFEIRRPGLPPSGAYLVASDATNDLALLQITAQGQASAPVRLDVRLGEPIAVFGYPLSRVLSSSGNFTLGNITALSGIGDDTRFVQISAPIQPGNSGGPLLDKYGNVVGVVTSKLDALVSLAATGDIPQNVNFAIRGSSLYAFLLAHGVQPEAASSEAALEAPDLAERAAGFSAAVVCK